MKKKTGPINEIMKDFDFDKVRGVMLNLDWKYWDSDGMIPSVKRLKQSAKDRLEDVSKKGCTESTSGGFTARRRMGEMEQEYFTLEFVIERKSTEK